MIQRNGLVRHEKEIQPNVHLHRTVCDKERPSVICHDDGSNSVTSTNYCTNLRNPLVQLTKIVTISCFFFVRGTLPLPGAEAFSSFRNIRPLSQIKPHGHGRITPAAPMWHNTSCMMFGPNQK